MSFGVRRSGSFLRIYSLTLIPRSHPYPHPHPHPHLHPNHFTSFPRIVSPLLRASIIGDGECFNFEGVSSWSPFLCEGVAGRRRGGRALTMSSSTSCLVEYALSPSCALKIQKGDITGWFINGSSDAIVNPANERMLGGGGADGAIHRAAGPQLKEACYEVPQVQPGVRCPTGEARITHGFRLPVAYVIHTVGPIYDVACNPEASLKNSYRNSLRVAKENNIQYIAFPAISCGAFRYPYDEAAMVAVSTVKEFGTYFKEVHFVLFSDDIYNAWVDNADKILAK